MTEELTFKESQRDGRAIELHEGLISAPAVSVDRVSDEFFAGAGFTFDQNRGVRRGYDSNLVQDSTESCARPYNVLKPVLVLSCTTLPIYVLIE
jgi:hypothetical protein